MRWIAAGDSYSAGEGSTKATGKCGRNDLAIAVQARNLVDKDVPVDTFVHVACDGAVTDDIPSQIQSAESANGNQQFNLVTLSVGGNDIGFSKVLVDCIGGNLVPGGRRGCSFSDTDLLDRAKSLTARLVPLYQAIRHELAPHGALVIMGYPNLVADPAVWPQDECSGISKQDGATFRKIGEQLDATIGDAARQASATYVSLTAAFDGHEVCGQKEQWLNGFEFGVANRTLRPLGSFHPNDLGLAAGAQVLAAKLRSLYKGS